MLENSLYVHCVLLDFSKAFDTVDNLILLKKLDTYRLPDNIIIIITRSTIVTEMTKSLHRHYRRFRERMTEEMGLQAFPENRY